ncbi:MAG: DUF2283 domain-containing protein [Candidatus Aenigmarchaeota archaeon]|nr:DUF2283 domain-containing protein [Candidatus Aenigmarchaeota archaeon]
MEKEINVWFDKEGDYLEITFGAPRRGYFKEIKGDVLQRIDSQTGEVLGFAFINFSKHFGEMRKPEEIRFPTSLINKS